MTFSFTIYLVNGKKIINSSSFRTNLEEEEDPFEMRATKIQNSTMRLVDNCCNDGCCRAGYFCCQRTSYCCSTGTDSCCDDYPVPEEKDCGTGKTSDCCAGWSCNPDKFCEGKGSEGKCRKKPAPKDHHFSYFAFLIGVILAPIVLFAILLYFCFFWLKGTIIWVELMILYQACFCYRW